MSTASTAIPITQTQFYTYASARNINKSASLQSAADAERLPSKLIQLDVTDAIQKIVSEKGRIDVLVNNAGYGLFGAFEDLSSDEIKAQFDSKEIGSSKRDNFSLYCTIRLSRTHSKVLSFRTKD